MADRIREKELEWVDRFVTPLAQSIQEDKEKIYELERTSSTNPLQASETIEWNKLFEQTHKEGSKSFGWDWINANERAINLCEALGIQSDHPQIKSFISQLVLAVLKKKL